MAFKRGRKRQNWVAVRVKENENPWVTYAKRQVYRKNNCINLVCVGAPGMGKSWGLLSYFNMIDPEFDIERVFFKASKLMTFFKEQKSMKGKPFLFDEAGIDANNLKWRDEINKGLNAFFQTGRHKNYVFGMTVPYLQFISKGVRTLMTSKFIAKGHTGNKTIIAPRLMEYNADLDMFYNPRLFVLGDNCFCNELHLPKPPKQLIKDYESAKKEFTSGLFDEISKRMKGHEDKEMRLTKTEFTERQETVLRLLKEGKTRDEAANVFGCSTVNISVHINRLKKKGIIFTSNNDGTYKINDYRTETSNNDENP